MESRHPPTLEEVESEIRELDSKIADLNQLVERKNLLTQYKAVLERIWSNGNGSHVPDAKSAIQVQAANTVSFSDTATAQISDSPTVNFAHKVLSASSKSMRVPEIIKGMLDLGWTGSGDDEQDKTKVYNALYNNSTVRFTRVRRGLWTTKK